MPSAAAAFPAVADSASGAPPESTDETQREDAAKFQAAQQALRSNRVMTAALSPMRQHSG